jgi:methyl-accepting chemotaxis protein
MMSREGHYALVQSIAPIRLKLLVAFGFMVGMLATVALAALLAPKGCLHQRGRSGYRDLCAKRSSGEYAELKTNFNRALDALRDLIGSVSTSAGSIRVGSDESAQASDDLARRTESNAASLAETSASLAQIDRRLKASTTAAGRTFERANEATGIVAGGRRIADEAVQAMGRVSDSAKGIDSVIEGLDKIAFQTRVLAMNAAVEAESG